MLLLVSIYFFKTREVVSRSHLLLALFWNCPTCIGFTACTVKVTEFHAWTRLPLWQNNRLLRLELSHTAAQCNVCLCLAQRKNIYVKKVYIFFIQIPDSIGISQFHLSMRISSWGPTLKNKTNRPKTTSYRVHFPRLYLCILNVISEISGSLSGRHPKGRER